MKAGIPMIAVALLLGAVLMGAVVSTDSDATDGTGSGPGTTSYSGTCGTTSAAKWTVESNKLTITETGNVSATSSWKVTAPAGSTTVKIDDVLKDVESIEINNKGMVTKQAFNSMAKATSVSFGTNHTSVDESLFEANKKITTVILKNVVTIGKNAFKGCTALTTLKDLSSVTTISESAFEGCTALKTLGSSATDIFGAVSIGKSAFKGCTVLEQFNIGKATAIDLSAFEGCTKLTKFIELADSKTPTDSKKFTVSNDIIYSDGKKTLYMCPPGKTGVINKIEPTVTKINLDYADVDYIIDASVIGNRDDVTFNTTSTASKSTGMIYYTQSINGAPAVKIEKDVFTMTYKLYSGWIVDSTTVNVKGGTVTSADSTSIKMSVAQGKGYSVYPVGYSKVVKSDLLATTINNWSVGDITLDCKEDPTSNAVTDITKYTCRIIGYSGTGSAILEQQLKNRGALCTVTGMEAGNYASLVNLTIKGDMILADGTFANCSKLKTVSMPGITEIKSMLFRYCTALESVDAKACAKIGSFAFEGCVKMTSLTLGAKTVDVSDGAFANCGSLKMLKVSESTEVKGNTGLFILHSNDNVSFEIYGDSLIVKGSGKGSLTYRQNLADEPKTEKFYSGGMASVFIGGMRQIYLSTVSGTPESDCLVVMESQMGADVKNKVVKYGSQLSDLEQLSAKGYTFKGWYTEKSGILSPVDEKTNVTGSMVLTAMWERDVSSDKTSMTLLVLFGIAVLASVAILAVNARR